MKTILIMSLLATAFAFVPAADATTCDPVTGDLCAGSYGYGTCDNGYASNGVYYYNYDNTGYTYVGANTYCSGYPGYYSYGGVGAGATVCDANWNCDYAGAYWYGYEFFGNEYCYSEAYTYVDGQYNYESLPLCEVAGSPPMVPSLGLP